ITACLWTTDAEESLDALVPWASQWGGPISLLMITTTRPMSVSHQRLLERLNAVKGHPSLSGLSLHLLHVTNNRYSPSANLNMARLFALSYTVMLFPANLSNILPSDFYNILSSSMYSSKKPLILASTITSAFSIPDLTPVILPRDYQLWCTERAFITPRTSDWDDCLWQLWLEEYGLGNVNVTLGESNTCTQTYDSNLLTKIRNRLSGKIRAEICDLAIKRLSTDALRTSKSGKRRLQWAKSFCRQVCGFCCGWAV
ncbi:hypothetical protein B0H10DRAFT_1782877, partial [Mycena sp. CBHHK59/15]